MLAILGDVFDAIGYVTVSLVLWRFRPALLFKGPGRTLALLLAGSGVHFAALNSLNRISGYPDKEPLPYLAVLFWFALHVAVLLNGPALRHQLRALTVLFCVVYLPVEELPGWALRQAVAAGVVPAKANGNFEVVYFTKLGIREAYAIGRQPPAQICTAAVFARQGSQYRLKRTVELLDGGGSMDRQTPNLPWALRLLLRCSDSRRQITLSGPGSESGSRSKNTIDAEPRLRLLTPYGASNGSSMIRNLSTW